MSGIIGIVCGSGLSENVSSLWNGLSALAHRGSGPPQILFVDAADSSTYTLRDKRVAPTFSPSRMIAAIGASDRKDPISSMSDRFYLALDGRIYNAPEILAECSVSPSAAGLNPDSAAVLAAYARWGSACLNRLVGMFAFAMLDTRSRTLFLARDCFGIKPLYYSVGKSFAFASQAGSLLEFAGIRARINPQRAYEFLERGTSDCEEETLLAEVRQLPPGHLMEVSFDELVPAAPSPYWQAPLDVRTGLSFDEAAETLRQFLLSSVRLHLRQSERAGSALSGGIDSSSIVGAMRAIAPDAPLHTFTFVGGSPTQRFEWDEEPWADMVGEATGAIMHKIHVSAQDLAKGFDNLVYLQDWPFGSPVIFAQHEVFRAAREAGISVLLSGQGADTFFAGSAVRRAASLLRSGSLWQAAQFIHRASANGNVRARKLLLSELEWKMKTQARTLALACTRFSSNLIHMSWFRERQAASDSLQNSREPSLVRSGMREALTSTLPGALRFEDRNSAACGIENRTPFLTPSIAEFGFSLPDEFLVGPDGTAKPLLRRAMAGLVPDAVLARKNRMGFPVPVQHWLAELAPWAEEVMAYAKTPVLDYGRLLETWQGFRSGRDCSWPSCFLIWRSLSFIAWARRFQVTFD